jgi:hypothetical protein
MREAAQERVTGFEPVISTLGKSHVATTPNPPGSHYRLLTVRIIANDARNVKLLGVRYGMMMFRYAG